MKSPRLILAAALGLLALSAAHAADWTEDYAAAAAKAKAEKKLLLLDFTGSDWCVWCKKIDADVLDTQKFDTFASSHFVLVKVDFPRKHKLADALKAQNTGLGKKYAIEGFPTLIVTDPDGRVVVEQVGYEEGGPDAFIAKVEKAAGS